MSILIPDMKMPTRCWDCPMCYDMMACTLTGLNWYRDTVNLSIDPVEERMPNCPLIELPPHGRLIDADALIADLKRQCREVFRVDAVSPDDFWITRIEAYNERLWGTWCESFFDYLQTRPTIIPAEEE